VKAGERLLLSIYLVQDNGNSRGSAFFLFSYSSRREGTGVYPLKSGKGIGIEVHGQ